MFIWLLFKQAQRQIIFSFEFMLCNLAICFTCFDRYDHPHILAGQGTMGLEIIEQVPDLDACIIPVGGGGLIAGAALAIKSLKPEVQIIVSISC